MIVSLIQEAVDVFVELFRRNDTTSEVVRSRERRLEVLRRLRERGDLSETEYEQQRRRVLDEA